MVPVLRMEFTEQLAEYIKRRDAPMFPPKPAVENLNVTSYGHFLELMMCMTTCCSFENLQPPDSTVSNAVPVPSRDTTPAFVSPGFPSPLTTARPLRPTSTSTPVSRSHKRGAGKKRGAIAAVAAKEKRSRGSRVVIIDDDV